MPVTIVKAVPLTRHPVHILKPDTPTRVFQNEGRESIVFDGERLEDYIMVELPGGNTVPRVGNQKSSDQILEIEGHQVELQLVGDVDKIEGLPDPVEKTIYIASSVTMAAAVRLGRKDVYAPATLVCVEENGKTTVVGTIGLKQNKILGDS